MQIFKIGTPIAIVLVFLAAFGGWVANVVKFIGMLHDPLGALFIARIVGIFFAPLGSILGFF